MVLLFAVGSHSVSALLDLDGDGSIFEIDSNKSTEVATDTTGAKLRTQDGNLFIKDGDTTIPITGSKDGAPVMLNESWTKMHRQALFEELNSLIEKAKQHELNPNEKSRLTELLQQTK